MRGHPVFATPGPPPNVLCGKLTQKEPAKSVQTIVIANVKNENFKKIKTSLRGFLCVYPQKTKFVLNVRNTG